MCSADNPGRGTGDGGSARRCGTCSATRRRHVACRVRSGRERYGNQGEPEFRFNNYGISFLADYVIRLRYLDLAGELSRIMAVKMHNSAYTKHIVEFDISSQGIALTGNRLDEHRALISSIAADWKTRSQSGDE